MLCSLSSNSEVFLCTSPNMFIVEWIHFKIELAKMHMENIMKESGNDLACSYAKCGSSCLEWVIWDENWKCEELIIVL